MRRVLAALALLGTLCDALPAVAATAADPQAEPKAVSCAECGMSAEVSGRFTARLSSGDATLYFCDIGDLVAFIERTHPKDFTAAVRDFPTGEWLDAAAAFYAIDKKAYPTPMGWGVAAFRDRAAVPGAALDFEALRKAQR